MADQTAQSIGKVAIVYGEVKAKSQDGVERILQSGGEIFLNDRINTGPEGAVSIIFTEPADTQLDLGRGTDMVIDKSVLGGEDVDLDEVSAEIAAIEKALEGDGEIDVAATAAGGGGAGTGGGGRVIYEDTLDGKVGEVTAGAETEGVQFGFTGTQSGTIIPEEEVVVPVTVAAATPFVPEPVVEVIPDIPDDIPPETSDPVKPSFSINRVVEEEAMDGGFGNGFAVSLFAVTTTAASSGLPSGTSYSVYDYHPELYVGGYVPSFQISQGNQDDIMDAYPNDLDVGPPEDPEDPNQPDSSVISPDPLLTQSGNLNSESGLPSGSTWLLTGTDGLPELTSQGEDIVWVYETGIDIASTAEEESYSVIQGWVPEDYFTVGVIGVEGRDGDLGDELAEMPARLVVTFIVDSNGDYYLALHDQIDHVAPTDPYLADENSDMALVDGGSVDSLDFSQLLQVTVPSGIHQGTWSDFPEGSFEVTVVDDIPTTSDGEYQIVQQVEEDGMDATVVPEDNYINDSDDLSTGNKADSGDGNSDDEAGGYWGSVAGLFSIGADEYPIQSEIPGGTYGITTSTTTLADLPALWSKGEQVQYESDGSLLTAYVGDLDGEYRVVFTFEVTEDGNWNFDLDDQLDHVAPGLEDLGGGEEVEFGPDGSTIIADENWALIAGEDQEGSVPYIDFSAILTATDFDGDMITGASEAGLVIEIQDDIPAFIGDDGVAINAVVDESGLNSEVVGDADYSDGNPDNAEDEAFTSDHDESGDQDPTVAGLFSIGTDEDVDADPTEVSYGFVEDGDGTGALSGLNALALSSQGDQVVWTSDGQKLTGTADGRVVMEVEITAATGAWSVELNDQFDHVAPVDPVLSEENEDLVGGDANGDIDLTQYLQATDYDGDTHILSDESGLFTVTVVDDVPETAVEPMAINAVVDESGLNSEVVGDADYSDGNPDNAEDEAFTSDHDESGDQDPTVAGLFSIGADEDVDADPTEVSYGFVEDGDGTGALSALNALALSSQGDQVVWTSDGQKLTGTADGRVVMEVEITAATGAWSVELNDQFDHVAPVDPVLSEENEDLVGGDANGDIDLTQYLQATDYDGDTHVLSDESGLFTVTVVDDVPETAVEPVAINAVVDESGLNLDAPGDADYSDGNPDNAEDEAFTSDHDESGDQDPTVAGLFSIGADEDEDADPTEVSYGFVEDGDGTGALSALNALALSSQGDQVVWTSDGQKLTGTADGRVVMEVEITAATGAWSVELNDQFDHVAPVDPVLSEENEDLVGGDANGDIDLTQYLQATDYDGDTHVLSDESGLFTVTVVDDVPETAVEPMAINAVVDESGLNLDAPGDADYSDGNPDNSEDEAFTSDHDESGDQDPTVAGLFSIGADEDEDTDPTEVSYGFVEDGDGTGALSALNALALSSQGDQVVWTSDGQKLTGTADGRVVMEVEITAATGAWSVELNDQFDHVAPVDPVLSEENEDLVGGDANGDIDLTQYLQATDYDGDTHVLSDESGLFTVTVVDDVPETAVEPMAINAVVDESGLNLDAPGDADYSDGNPDNSEDEAFTSDHDESGDQDPTVAGLFSIGADEDEDTDPTEVSYGFVEDGDGTGALSALNALALSSQGDQVVWTSDGQKLTGTADGRVVMEVEITAATGAWSVELNDQFDHVAPVDPVLSEENEDLVGGDANGDIDLTQYLQATDYDGDTHVLSDESGLFTVTVVDDVPETAVEPMAINAVVDESGLNLDAPGDADYSDGNPDNSEDEAFTSDHDESGDQDPTVAGLFSIGADEDEDTDPTEVSYGFVEDGDGTGALSALNALALSSQGDQVVWTSDGQKLTGTADGRVVMEVEITAATGAWSVELNDQFDHVAPVDPVLSEENEDLVGGDANGDIDLTQYLQATDYDGDTHVLSDESGLFTVTVVDDVPETAVKPVAINAVVDESGLNLDAPGDADYSDGNPDNAEDEAFTSDHDESGDQDPTVAGLFSIGADEDEDTDPTEVSYGFVEDGDGTGALSALNALALSSQGDQVVWTSDGQKLTGTADGRVVMEVEITAATGAWSVELNDQFDHVAPVDPVLSEENEDLVGGDANGDIDLTQYLQATDYDGDTHVLSDESGLFTVTVVDDVPETAVKPVAINAVVDESGLNLDAPGDADYSDGNPDNAEDEAFTSDHDESGDQDPTVAGLFSIGADEDEDTDPTEVSYGFVEDGDGTGALSALNALALSSQGDQVVWTSDGQKLTGTADGRVVMEVEITAATGAWSVELNDQFDHVAPVDPVLSEENEDLVGGDANGDIDLTQYLQATDYDGDTHVLSDESGLFTVTVVDDVPETAVKPVAINAVVDESGLNLDAPGDADYSDGNPDNAEDEAFTSDHDESGDQDPTVAGLFSIGADEDEDTDPTEVSYGFVEDGDGTGALSALNALALSSQGDQVVWTSDGQKLTGTADGRVVMEVEITAATGAWSVELNDQFDHVAPVDPVLSEENEDLVGGDANGDIDLTQYLQATDYDGDTHVLSDESGLFTVTVVDDVPETAVKPVAINAVVDESGLNSEVVGDADYSDGNPDNAEDEAFTSDHDESGDQDPTVAGLFSIGADEDEDTDPTDVSYGFVEDGDGTGALSALNALALSSQGDQVVWTSDGQKLTGTADGRVVMEVEITAATGAWSVELNDQFDHVAPVDPVLSEENEDLVGGDANGDIDLTQYLQATDYDGDTHVLSDESGLFTVTVVDDVPETAVEPVAINAVVDESGLNSEVVGDADYSDGNPDNAEDEAFTSDHDESGDQDPTVAGLFSIGADEDEDADPTDVSYGFVEDGDGTGALSALNALALSSQGDQVVWTSDGQKLTGTADGRVVMEVEITAATGAWSVELNDQFDHVAPVDPVLSEENEDLVGGDANGDIDLTQYLQATDYDGDTHVLSDESGLFTVTVVDDVPEFTVEGIASGTVYEDALGIDNDVIDPDDDNNPLNNDNNDADSDSSLGNVDDVERDTDTVTVELSSLIADSSIGADELEGSEEEGITYGIVGADGEQLGKSEQTTDGGESIYYFKEGDNLVARTGNNGTADSNGTVVFTVSVLSSTGSLTFDLEDQLDHGLPGDDGIFGTSDDDAAGDDGTLVVDDFGKYIQAGVTDFDGDMADSETFAGKIAITVENDVPILNGSADFLMVEEEMLDNFDPDYVGPDGVEGSDGNPDDTGDVDFDPDNDVTDSGDLSALVTVGADEELTYAFVEDVDTALKSANDLYSKGDQVSYEIDAAGDTLTASAGGREVFKVELDQSDGSYDFTLYDQLDHATPLEDDPAETRLAVENGLTLNLGVAMQAIDADGDAVAFGEVDAQTGEVDDKVQVEVADDIPVAKTPADDVPLNLNLVIIMDESNSMDANIGGETRLDAMRNAVNDLLDQLGGSSAANIRVHMVQFSTDASVVDGNPQAVTYDIRVAGGEVVSTVVAAQAAVSAELNTNGGTNWEAAIKQAVYWTENGDQLVAGVGNVDAGQEVVNEVIFISDGEPTFYYSNDNGDAPEVYTLDGSNSTGELAGPGGSFTPTGLAEAQAAFTDLNDWAVNSGGEVQAVGIGLTDATDLAQLGTLDSSGVADNITTSQQLVDLLSEYYSTGTQPLISAEVIEDDMSTDAPYNDSTDGSGDPALNGDEDSDDGTESENLANLFLVGADEELKFSLDPTAIDNLPTLYSGYDENTQQPVALSYSFSQVGTESILTATAGIGGDPVFTFTVDEDGSWDFDLQGQLNHVEGNDENYELQTDGEPVDGIDLSEVILATDFDGDAVNANAGTFVVEVQDDVPVTESQVGYTFGYSSYTGAEDDFVGTEHTVEFDLLSEYGADGPDIPTTITLLDDADGKFEVVDGTVVFTPDEDWSGETEITYEITDADGDTAQGTLKVIENKLIVGQNVSDTAGSQTTYEVGEGADGNDYGIIDGGAGNDILIGDVGGIGGVGSALNLMLILDTSGSMAFDDPDRIEHLQNAVNNLIDDLQVSNAEQVRIHIVEFSQLNGTGTVGAGNTGYAGTYDLFAADGSLLVSDIKSQISDLEPQTGTNYEAGMQQALEWIAVDETSGGPLDGANNVTLFITDGNPNHWIDDQGGEDSDYHGFDSSYSEDIAMDQILGIDTSSHTYNPPGPGGNVTHGPWSDSASEVAALDDWGRLKAIGIGTDPDLENLDLIDEGDAITTSGEGLYETLSDLIFTTDELANVGDDTIIGGDGDDLIFGDALFTDTLAENAGLDTNLGAGWEVFEELEGNGGTGSHSWADGTTTTYDEWSRTDTIRYIEENAAELAQESDEGGDPDDSFDDTRSGGDDTIDGGDGDDITFAQEGDDMVDGGSGDDVLVGGTGDDDLDGEGDSDLLVGDAIEIIDGDDPDSDPGDAVDIVDDGVEDDLDGGSTGVDNDTSVDDTANNEDVEEVESQLDEGDVSGEDLLTLLIPEDGGTP